MRFRDHFRGAADWRSEGLPLTNATDEACKLYDAALTQLTTLYEDERLGGLERTMARLNQVGHDFVLGQALCTNMSIIGFCDWPLDRDIKERIEKLQSLRDRQRDKLTPRELLHVSAVEEFYRGNMSEALEIWGKITIDYPTDVHALRSMYDASYMSGDGYKLASTYSRAIPVWEAKEVPLKSSMYAYWAFGENESGNFDECEKIARKGIEMNYVDTANYHNLAHCYHDTFRHERGGEELDKSLDRWQGSIFTRHVYWHLALFRLQMGLDIDDLLPKILVKEPKIVLDIIDNISLIYRMDLLGLDSLDWSDLGNVSSKYALNGLLGNDENGMPLWLTSAGLGFRAAHYAMALCSSNKYEEIYSQHGLPLSNLCAVRQTAKPAKVSKLYGNGVLSDKEILAMNTEKSDALNRLISAIIAYKQKHFDDVVELLYPVIDQVTRKFGGSNAQMDIFNILLIVAALRSAKLANQKIGEKLMAKRATGKVNDKSIDLMWAWKSGIVE